MALSEAQIEAKVCKYARSKGFDAFKQTWPGTHGAPDRLLVSPKGDIFMVEFKSARGKLTAHQERRIAKLRDKRVKVYIINNVEAGKGLVDWYANS